MNDSSSDARPSRARQIGEEYTLPIMGSVAHANATGVWIRHLPITPEKILNPIREKKKAEESVAV